MSKVIISIVVVSEEKLQVMSARLYSGKDNSQQLDSHHKNGNITVFFKTTKIGILKTLAQK